MIPVAGGVVVWRRPFMRSAPRRQWALAAAVWVGTVIMFGVLVSRMY
jgi:hypothetical protein